MRCLFLALVLLAASLGGLGLARAQFVTNTNGTGTANAIREGGGSRLTFSTIGANQLLYRNGTTIDGTSSLTWGGTNFTVNGGIAVTGNTFSGGNSGIEGDATILALLQAGVRQFIIDNGTYGFGSAGIKFRTPSGAIFFQGDNSGNLIPGAAALATSATDGFLYQETTAGVPTGTPTAYTGRVATVYDTTHDREYIYNGSWKQVGGAGDYFAAQRTAAQNCTGISAANLAAIEAEFYSTALWTSSTVGTGSVTAAGINAGRYTLTTGTSTSGRAIATLNTIQANPKIEAWYMAARARVSTTTDANTTILIPARNSVLASENTGLYFSNNVLNLRLMIGGVATTVATSWTPEASNYHNFAVCFDLTTVTAYVDGVSVGSTATLTNMSTATDSGVSIDVNNGATAAAQTVIVDAMVYYSGRL